MPLLLALLACAPPSGDTPNPWPAPDAWRRDNYAPPGHAAAPLFEACAYLTGGPEDVEHHNMGLVVDGLLVFPWAPEDGGGGLSLFDMTDPCAPVRVVDAYHPWMRESHTLGLSLRDDGRYVAVDYLQDTTTGGVGIWDLTDPSDPRWISEIALPGHTYPDSYTRLTLSVTWVGPYIYASTTGLGVFIIDATDPFAPEIVGQLRFDRPHIVGSFHVWGNRAMAASAGVARTLLMDVSDPLNPTPLPGGDFTTRDPDGDVRPYYFSNLGAQWGLFARSEDGGGPMVYDLTDGTAPTFVSATSSVDGDGGYVYQHEDHLFVGDSNFGSVYDFADPTAPTAIGRFDLPGDLDTVTPLGSVALVSVDEKGEPGRATAVMPWSATPDTRGPRPGMTSPRDGDRFQAATTRVGVVFDELLEPVSAFAGSVRLFDTRGAAVAGFVSAQENVVNFVPDAPLAPNTTYRLLLPAGGLADVSGNALEAPFTLAFTTAP
jgi:hypothetical protein